MPNTWNADSVTDAPAVTLEREANLSLLMERSRRLQGFEDGGIH